MENLVYENFSHVMYMDSLPSPSFTLNAEFVKKGNRKFFYPRETKVSMEVYLGSPYGWLSGQVYGVNYLNHVLEAHLVFLPLQKKLPGHIILGQSVCLFVHLPANFNLVCVSLSVQPTVFILCMCILSG